MRGRRQPSHASPAVKRSQTRARASTMPAEEDADSATPHGTATPQHSASETTTRGVFSALSAS